MESSTAEPGDPCRASDIVDGREGVGLLDGRETLLLSSRSFFRRLDRLGVNSDTLASVTSCFFREYFLFSPLERFTVDGDAFLLSCSVSGRDATSVYPSFLLLRFERLGYFMSWLGAGLEGDVDTTGDSSV